jgi:hypothetical protein
VQLQQLQQQPQDDQHCNCQQHCLHQLCSGHAMCWQHTSNVAHVAHPLFDCPTGNCVNIITGSPAHGACAAAGAQPAGAADCVCQVVCLAVDSRGLAACRQSSPPADLLMNPSCAQLQVPKGLWGSSSFTADSASSKGESSLLRSSCVALWLRCRWFVARCMCQGWCCMHQTCCSICCAAALPWAAPQLTQSLVLCLHRGQCWPARGLHAVAAQQAGLGVLLL